MYSVTEQVAAEWRRQEWIKNSYVAFLTQLMVRVSGFSAEFDRSVIYWVGFKVRGNPSDGEGQASVNLIKNMEKKCYFNLFFYFLEYTVLTFNV